MKLELFAALCLSAAPCSAAERAVVVGSVLPQVIACLPQMWRGPAAAALNAPPELSRSVIAELRRGRVPAEESVAQPSLHPFIERLADPARGAQAAAQLRALDKAVSSRLAAPAAALLSQAAAGAGPGSRLSADRLALRLRRLARALSSR